MERIIYQDFGGYNDTASPFNLKKGEFRTLKNFDIGSGEGLRTRKGCSLAGGGSISGEWENLFEWVVAGSSRIIGVANGKVYAMTVPEIFAPESPPSLQLTEKLTLGRNNASFLTIQNKLYIMDGMEIYVWGAWDYDATLTTNVGQGEIVRNTPASSGGGILGYFYQAKSAMTAVNLTTTDFSNLSLWQEVTDTPGVISKVIRPVSSYGGGKREKVKLTINYVAASAGNVTVTLNKVNQNVAVAANDTATAVAGKIRAASFSGWTTGGSGNVVEFTATIEGVRDDAFYDPGTTGAYGVIETVTQGAADDNNISEARRCKYFAQHPLSLRVFAIGNPYDPTAVYFSEPNVMDYWKKASVLRPTTPERAAVALLPVADDMLVGFDNSWWRWGGIDANTDAVWKQLPLPYGPVSPKAVVLTPFSFTFASVKGIHTVSVSILSQEALLFQSDQVIQTISERKVEKTLATMVNPAACQLVFHNERLYLAYGDDPFNTRNNKVLVYNKTSKGFFEWDGWQVNAWVKRAGGELWFASKNYLLVAESGTHDIDLNTGAPKAIKVKFETRPDDLSIPLSLKYLQNLYIIYKQEKSTEETSITVNVNVDYQKVCYPNVLLADSFVWGRQWGLTWGWTDLAQLMAELREFGNHFTVTVECSMLDSPLTIYALGYEFKRLRAQGRPIDDPGRLIR